MSLSFTPEIDIEVCKRLIDTYDKISGQLYNLALAWTKFGERDKL